MPNIKPIVSSNIPSDWDLFPLPCGDVCHHKADPSCSYPNKYFILDEQKQTALIVHAGCESIRLTRAEPLSATQVEILLSVPEGLFKRYKVTEGGSVEFVASTVEEIEEYRTMEKVVATAVSGRYVPPAQRLSHAELVARYPDLLSTTHSNGESEVEAMERFMAGTVGGTQPKPYTPNRLLFQKKSEHELATRLANPAFAKSLLSRKAHQGNEQATQADQNRLISLGDHPLLMRALEGFPCSDIAHTSYSYTCPNSNKYLSVNLRKATGAITHSNSMAAPHLQELHLLTHQMQAVLAAAFAKQQVGSVEKISQPFVNMGVLAPQKPSKKWGVAATEKGKEEGVQKRRLMDLLELIPGEPTKATSKANVQPRVRRKDVFQAGEEALDRIFEDNMKGAAEKPQTTLKSISELAAALAQKPVKSTKLAVEKAKKEGGGRADKKANPEVAINLPTRTIDLTSASLEPAATQQSRGKADDTVKSNNGKSIVTKGDMVDRKTVADWDNIFAERRAAGEAVSFHGGHLVREDKVSSKVAGSTSDAHVTVKKTKQVEEIPRPKVRKWVEVCGHSIPNARTTKPASTTKPTTTTAPAVPVMKDEDADWEAVEAEEAVESEYVFI